MSRYSPGSCLISGRVLGQAGDFTEGSGPQGKPNQLELYPPGWQRLPHQLFAAPLHCFTRLTPAAMQGHDGYQQQQPHVPPPQVPPRPPPAPQPPAYPSEHAPGAPLPPPPPEETSAAPLPTQVSPKPPPQPPPHPSASMTSHMQPVTHAASDLRVPHFACPSSGTGTAQEHFQHGCIGLPTSHPPASMKQCCVLQQPKPPAEQPFQDTFALEPPLEYPMGDDLGLTDMALDAEPAASGRPGRKPKTGLEALKEVLPAIVLPAPAACSTGSNPDAGGIP